MCILQTEACELNAAGVCHVFGRPVLLKNQFVVVVEGLDGSGKSSLIALLRDAFMSKGLKVFLGDWFREKDVQRLAMVFNTQDQMSPEVLAAMHGVSTIFQIKESRASDCEVVLWDRYIYSSFASCVNRGASQELMKTIVGTVPTPNLAILLSEDPSVCYERIVQRKGLRFFESNIDRLFRGRIGEALEAFSKGQIPQTLLREVFVTAGHEWYTAIGSIMEGICVYKVENFDLAKAASLVERIVGAYSDSTFDRPACTT